MGISGKMYNSNWPILVGLQSGLKYRGMTRVIVTFLILNICQNTFHKVVLMVLRDVKKFLT